MGVLQGLSVICNYFVAGVGAAAARPRPVQFNPLLEVIELLAEEVVAKLAATVGKTVSMCVLR